MFKWFNSVSLVNKKLLRTFLQLIDELDQCHSFYCRFEVVWPAGRVLSSLYDDICKRARCTATKAYIPDGDINQFFYV